MKRAAIYTRVSTRDLGQTTANQVPVLRKLARDRGYELVASYDDTESGGESQRPGFLKLFADAEAGKFDVLLIWSLDRFTREGAYPTLDYLERLSKAGVGILSYTEQFLDTTGIFRDVIIALLAVLAQQERQRASERVKAGVARVRGATTPEGETLPPKPWGRRAKIAGEDLEQFQTLMAKGLTVDELAQYFQCSRALVYRIQQRLRAAA